MPYGQIKVDEITFTNAGVDQTISVSGVVASISGNITATGTISGDVIRGGTLVSGATVTGTAGQFGTITGNTAGFTTVTGTTVTGTTANFVTVSGTTVTGTTAQFTTVTGGTAGFTTITGTTVTGTTANFVTVSGTTVTGNVGNFTTITGGSAGFTTVTGTTITGTTLTVASGTFTGNSTAAAFIPTGSTVPTNGVYLPAANSVAISTGGAQRLRVSATKVGVFNANATDTVTLYRNNSGNSASFTAGIINSNTTNDVQGPNAQINFETDSFWFTGRLTFSTSGDITAGGLAERMRIDGAGRVGIGTNSPSCLLNTQSSSAGELARFATSAGSGEVNISVGFTTTNQFKIGYDTATGDGILQTNTAGSQMLFKTVSAERARIDSSGRLLVGTSSTDTSYYDTTTFTPHFQFKGSTASSSSMSLTRTDGSGPVLWFQAGPSLGSNAFVGGCVFSSYDGANYRNAARIEAFIDGATGSGDVPGRLVFSTTADGASSPTERMRISQGGIVMIGSSNSNPVSANATGISFHGAAGLGEFTRDSDPCMRLNRKTNDGDIVEFYQDGTEEGSISVSGTAVSYNGAHLSRWSQLPGGAERTEILRGSVLSNLDEMCEWGEEDNEQLNRMKVSDVEGDKNVSGVFQAWDDDDDTYTDDFYCAMTGDFIIRIAEGTTVERGDLLMSAGDGTAKPQGDGYVQDKTIAKVTSTNVSCTYEDGSYCVPCVLMAC